MPDLTDDASGNLGDRQPFYDGFGQRARADEIARPQQLAARLASHGCRQLTHTECRTLERVFAEAFCDRLLALEQGHLEARELSHKLWNFLGTNVMWLADDEGGMQTVRGDDS